MKDLSDSFNTSRAANSSTRAKRPKRKRPSPISVRVTDAERAELERRAAGMSLSGYMKECALGKAAKPRKTRSKFPVKDHQALARVLRQLGDAYQLKDFELIADSASDGQLLLSVETDAALRQACLDISAMRADLIAALGLKAR